MLANERQIISLRLCLEQATLRLFSMPNWPASALEMFFEEIDGSLDGLGETLGKIMVAANVFK